MGKLIKLRASLFDTPHLIRQEEAKSIMQYLDARCNEKASYDDEDYSKKADTLPLENGVGLLKVDGTLTYKSTGWEAMCGGTSYQTLRSDMQSLLEHGAHTVVMEVDSGGGEAYGCFETAKELREMADQHGAKLVAFVDGISASAAYALSCCCHEIVANPRATVGSIGVVTMFRNTNERDKKEGVSTTYVYAGDNKIPFNVDGEFRQEFLDDVQSRVDTLYGDFVSHVSQLRSLSPEAVKATQAATYFGEQALSMGLVDKTMTASEFYSTYLPEMASSQELKRMRNHMFGFSNKKVKEEASTPVEAVETTMASELAEIETKETKENMEDLQKAHADAAGLKELLAQRDEEIASLKASILESKNKARMEALSSVLDKDQAPAMFAATEALDDAAFDTVVKGFAAKQSAEASSELFSEVGVAGEANTTDVAEESAEMRLIKQKFGK